MVSLTGEIRPVYLHNNRSLADTASVSRSIQGSVNLLRSLLSERYLAGSSLGEVALGRVKWVVVTHVSEILKCASV